MGAGPASVTLEVLLPPAGLGLGVAVPMRVTAGAAPVALTAVFWGRRREEEAQGQGRE